ncbi:transcription-silencing protein Clr2-domain-containing protein [Boeremia exigua]|uniref:transcription-silencing protein Clr2-domain-containing protein n=1 Tax=Boeremia exigua TaxID=749465 RepID=UPI001E8D26C4|nr:transcription-silencing protein Clr2-domain-containing protein [Boeremia exigua]KAH6614341.1 transcription-silencing protein Clr2-domain-containing protein [Boeremia exigua]
MTQPLTSFYPIFASKSDGLDVVHQKGSVVRNGPTQDQLDRSPNAQGQCDYYRLIEKDDPKHVDWRKKLGGMLLREIGGKQHEDKWQQCILWEFPESYKLYEHIKTKADGQAKTSKNHSGGGHDRQDAYLYGYPKGPRKRFRSPVEFFPHLLWLCTDETTDMQNCTCKMCSPVQLEVEKPAVKVETRAEVKKESSSAQVTGQNPIVQIPARRVSNPPPVQSPATKPATPAAPQIRAPTPLQSTQLPDPRSIDQQVDGLYHKFLSRQGEVVWYYKPKTGAWGLGVVIRRWLDKSSGGKTYVVQPLSHPHESLAPQFITTELEIKPWLAWSAPSYTYTYLQQHPTIPYEKVDWQGLAAGRYGPEGVASVDASIMAAKAVDATYTLFECLKKTANDGVQDAHYNGLFLGAEKIWRGDAVRLRIGRDIDVMVVTDIIERTSQQATGQATSAVLVVGDIYSYTTTAVSSPAQLPEFPKNTNLPTRMREDMIWRNQLLVPHARTFAYWKLSVPGSRYDIAEVKGRWYETALVFEDPFTKSVKNNEGGNGVWMNSRGDASQFGRATGVPVPQRLQAFGRALPEGTQLVDGVEPPEQSQPAQEVGIGISGHTDVFTDLMDFDHLGEGPAQAYDFHF